MKKFFKRIVVAVAALAVLCSVPLMSACDSDHPEAVITISYNDVEYKLNYKLYRNMYPQTVKHFIELADADFYDNTIIHSYESSYFYGGGYSYNVEGYESDYVTDFEEGATGMRDYFAANSKEEEYYKLATDGTLTPSVYRDYIEDHYIDALPSVIGEVGNTHDILNGALSGGFGALRMFYSAKSKDNGSEEVVYLDKDGNEDGTILASYLQHSATSMFSIQTSSSVGSTSYCIFGELLNTDVLTDLTKAVADGTSISVTDVPIDQYDPIVDGNNSDDFTVRSLPLIVVSVEITKR